MEFPTQFSGGRTYNIPYLIVFDNDEKATHYGFASSGPEITSYKLEGDKISLTISNQNWVFTIKDSQITAFSGIVTHLQQLNYTRFQLQTNLLESTVACFSRDL